MNKNINIDKDWLNKQESYKKDLVDINKLITKLEKNNLRKSKEYQELYEKYKKTKNEYKELKKTDKKLWKDKKSEYKNKLKDIRLSSYKLKMFIDEEKNKILAEKEKLNQFIEKFEKTEELRNNHDDELIKALTFSALKNKIKIELVDYEKVELDTNNISIDISFDENFKPRINDLEISIGPKRKLKSYELFEITKTDNWNERIREISLFLDINKPSKLKTKLESTIIKVKGTKYLNEFK